MSDFYTFYAKDLKMCTQGTEIELEDLLPKEMRAMIASTEHCLDCAKEAGEEVNKVDTTIHTYGLHR